MLLSMSDKPTAKKVTVIQPGPFDFDRCPRIAEN
jgi:hypothetical protein